MLNGNKVVVGILVAVCGAMAAFGATLPAEYQEVEWIKSDGAGYIQLGVKPDETSTLDMVFNTGTFANGVGFFGVGSFSMSENKDGTYYFNNVSLCPKANDCEAHLVVMTNAADNVSLTIEKAECETTVKTVALGLSSAQYGLPLFSGWNSYKPGYFSTFALRSFKLTQGGETIRDLVPCYRREDGQIGVYCTVSNEFLAATTANFTKGDDAGNFSVGEIPEQLVLGTGAVATPKPTVTALDGVTELRENDDYDLAYVDNGRSGLAAVRVIGKGAYSGVVTRFFRMRVGRLAKVAGGSAETDGSTWTKAMDFEAALGVSAAGDVVFLPAGDYDVSVRETGYSVTNGVHVRGGYEADDADPLALAAQPLTVIDGGNAITPLFTFSNGDGTASMERMGVVHSSLQGVNKSGAGRLNLLSCLVASNGCANTTAGTRGLYAASCDMIVSNCVFRGNTVPTNITKYNDGVALSLATVNIKLVDTDFLDNGLDRAAAGGAGNRIQGSAIYKSRGQMEALNCRFIGNRIGLNGGGTVYVNEGVSRFDHCAFVANAALAGSAAGCVAAGALVFSPSKYAGTHEINNCTFAYNLSNANNAPAALYVGPETVRVRNSIFYGNIVPPTCTVGADIFCSDAAAGTTYGLDADYVFLAENTAQFVSCGTRGGAEPTLTLHEHVFTGDPQFVTAFADMTAMLTTVPVEPSSRLAVPIRYAGTSIDGLFSTDVHLLSPEGYIGNDGAWHKSDGVLSPAIDKGDPACEYSLEPEPRGEAINLGVYGGTPSASKTPQAGQPVVGSVTVEFENEYTQPTVCVKMTGETPGAVYAAEVTIAIGGYSRTYRDVPNGAELRWKVSGFLPEEAAYEVSVTADAGPGTDVATGAAGGLARGKKPIWAGHGGGDTVIHVFSGATGANDGTSWTDAFTNLHEALVFIPATKREVWVATNLVVSGNEAGTTVSWTVPVSIRGGFTGAEDRAEERPDGLVTVYDGRDEQYGLTLDLNKPTGGGNPGLAATYLIERMRFQHCKGAGLSASHSQYYHTLALADCAVVSNGQAAAMVYNHNNYIGAFFRGTESSAHDLLSCMTLTNCLFACNALTNGTPFGCLGCGATFMNFGRVEMRDCAFVENGLTLEGAAVPDPQKNQHPLVHGALLASSARIFADGCRFVGNAVRGSGVCELSGVVGCSRFRNCLWLGNEEVASGNETAEAGMVSLSIGTTASASDYTNVVSFVNCTFAYNLAAATYNGSAALNVKQGTACVTNSIFYGNVNRAGIAAGSDIQLVPAEGKNPGFARLEVDYTLFAEDSTNSVNRSGDSTIVKGSHNVYANPKFETVTRRFLRLVSVPDETTATVSRATTPFCFDAAQAASVRALSARLRGGSPAIDAGDPASDWSREPSPNGYRVNLGAYGNTPWASCRHGTLLLVK